MKLKKNSILLIVLCSLWITAVSQNIDTIANEQDDIIYQADSLMANYKFERALIILAKGDSLDKDILLRIGRCNFLLGASNAAIRPYERVLQLDSVNVTALNQLGSLYARNADYENALSCFVHLTRLDSTSSYYCKQVGTMASRAADKLTAIYWFRKTLDLNPRDSEASLALGNLLMDLEAYDQVDVVVEEALAVDPQFKPLLLLQASSWLKQQDYESVIISINNLLENSDTTAVYARMLGISYFRTQDYNKVIACMKFLLSNLYAQDWIYFYMGVASRELGDVNASITWFRLAAQESISSNTKTYYSHLGQSYEDVGNYTQAIKAYRAAYNYSKDNILLYHLARNYDVYYKDKATALEYYKKYLESDDTVRLAREYAKQRLADMGEF